jgi:hypothetical protein
VRSRVPDVTVRVGDRVVGTTPLEETIVIPPGAHRVEATRAGYRRFPAEVEVEHGQEREVEVELEIDPGAPPDALGRLRLALPQPASAVRLDGAVLAMEGGSATVPIGRDDLVVELPYREPVRERIEVSSDSPLELRPALRWTPEARQARLDGASSQRLWGTVLTIGGAAALAATAGMIGWNEARTGERDALRPSYDACQGTGLCSIQMEREAQDYLALDSAIGQTRWLVYGGAALAAVATGVGIGFLVSAPSDDDVDRAAGMERASLRLHIGLDGVRAHGTF